MEIQGNNILRRRIVSGIFLLVFLIIVLQLLHLQLFSSAYRMQAENNAIFREVQYPDRGIIYDRHHLAILDNEIDYDLTVVPADARKGVDVDKLCHILNIDTAEYNKRITTAIIKNSSYKSSTFEPLLTQELYAEINENLYKFPGFALQQRPVRVYPFHCGANFLGRIGEVSGDFLKRHPDAGYQAGDYTGLSGLEKQYEAVLMGQRGVRRLLRDNHARLQGPYNNGEYDTAAIAGKNLYTSVDIKVQQLGEQMFQGKFGAAVAIDPKTGGIIAMVTAPGYDPNDLTPGEYRNHIGFLVTDTSQPMFNRAISGMYPPGSTYKPIGALIALDERVITPLTEYDCSRPYYACGKVVHNDENGGEHETLRSAIAHSYNSYFCNVFKLTLDNPAYGSPRKGYAVWQNYMNAFGFGRTLGVDVPGERKGNIPDTSEYIRDYGSHWVSCNLITIGIGQDRMLMTPLQSANEACIIANKGWYYTPHFIDSIEGKSGSDTVYLAKYHIKHIPLHIKDEDFRVVQEGMRDVTEVGTAHNVTIPGIKYAAKTGTAQVVRLKNLAVFIAYAPVDNPKIAIAVYVENAGYGAIWAAPIAAHMMEQYLNDSLTKNSRDDVVRLSKINLFPPQIYEWRRKRDSLDQMRKERKEKQSTTSLPVGKQPTEQAITILNHASNKQ